MGSVLAGLRLGDWCFLVRDWSATAADMTGSEPDLTGSVTAADMTGSGIGAAWLEDGG